MVKEKFKKKISLEERKKEAARILQKYPDRIPMIVERSNVCKNIDEIDRQKYLVPCDLTMGQFVFVIRKRIKLDSSQGLYFYVNNRNMVTSSEIISNVYHNHKDEDGFLYIEYAGESTFG